MTWVASSTRMPASERDASMGRATGGSATDDAAEQHPALAIEALQLHLPDRVKIAGAGADENSRQHHRQLQILEVLGLPHDVLAGEVIAALSQHLHQRLPRAVAVDIEPVGNVGIAVVLLHPGQPIPVARAVLPLAVG